MYALLVVLACVVSVYGKINPIPWAIGAFASGAATGAIQGLFGGRSWPQQRLPFAFNNGPRFVPFDQPQRFGMYK